MTPWQIATGQIMGVRPLIPTWQLKYEVAPTLPIVIDGEAGARAYAKQPAKAPVMRDRLREYIANNPGCSFTEMADAIIGETPKTPRWAVSDALKAIGCELRKDGTHGHYTYRLRGYE